MSAGNDIFSQEPGNGNGKRFSEDELMAYLEGKLPAVRQHEIERWLADEGMESDALEGLKELDAKETKASVNRLNYNLYRTIYNKKRLSRQLVPDQYTWIAIAIILLLIVAGYIIIRKLTGQ